jgi:hypothetical protein
MEIRKRLNAVEEKVGIERNLTTIKLDLVLPQDDIRGIHFNEAKVYAVFELKDDDWYYSKDILFLSARCIDQHNDWDILSEYLNSHSREDHVPTIREQIAKKIGVNQHKIEVSLPENNQGIKKYNGVRCRYWLYYPIPNTKDSFGCIDGNGNAYGNGDIGVGGCAPCFHFVERNKSENET